MKDRRVQLPREIRSALARLRRRIRLYVFIEGVTIAVVWLGLTFWIGLALDYVPVVLGASEMPLTARVVLLALIAAVLGFILYRWVVRRVFVRLRNQSMAVVLERRFRQFHDALLTSVELAPEVVDSNDLSHELLASSRQRAASVARGLRISEVFNPLPLLRKSALAALMVLSIIGFGMISRNALALWTQRLYLLSDDPWPRQAHIEILDFHQRQRKVGVGTDFTLNVLADARRKLPPPDVCTIYYRTDDGERGRVHMNKSGGIQDGHQAYNYSGKPFRGIQSDIHFDVVGYDHRLSDYTIVAVDNPEVVGVWMDSDMPAYTGKLPIRREPFPWLPRPKGSRVRLHARTNKPLTEVRVQRTVLEKEQDVLVLDQKDQPSNEFSIDLGTIDSPVSLEMALTDVDGVESRQPYHVSIGVTEDNPPDVAVRLNGIGNEITTNARLPVSGSILDDYGVESAWFDIQIDDGESQRHSLSLGKSGVIDQALDLRQKRANPDHPIQLEEGQKLVLSVQAMDGCDLDGGPNLGGGEKYSLDVVSASEILASLEARELNLRRRFEQMIVEMKENRDSLFRVKISPDAETADSDVSEEERNNEEFDSEGVNSEDVNEEDRGDEEQNGVDSNDVDSSDGTQSDAAERARSLRLLRVQRARQHGQRAAREVMGVAASFDDIRDELINNRVDTQERKERIEKMISAPLKRIVNNMFPEWESRLKDLESSLDGHGANSETDRALEQADAIVAAMENVLANMVEIEDYNELMDLLRTIIEQQEELMERTKDERKRQLFRL